MHNEPNPTTPDVPEHRSYSTVEVARRMGVSVPTVQRWVDAGQLQAWKTLGGHRRIDAASAEALFATRGAPLAREPKPAPWTGKGLRVVVVDDNPDDRDVLSALVEEALPDATCVVAENGFTGLMAIGHGMPQVVITDLQMPQMDGMEMLRQVSASSKSRPSLLVAVSSMTDAQLAQRGSLPDDVHFIRKPIDDPQAFIELLRKGAVAAVLSPDATQQS